MARVRTELDSNQIALLKPGDLLAVGQASTKQPKGILASKGAIAVVESGEGLPTNPGKSAIIRDESGSGTVWRVWDGTGVPSEIGPEPNEFSGAGYTAAEVLRDRAARVESWVRRYVDDRDLHIVLKNTTPDPDTTKKQRSTGPAAAVEATTGEWTLLLNPPHTTAAVNQMRLDEDGKRVWFNSFDRQGVDRAGNLNVLIDALKELKLEQGTNVYTLSGITRDSSLDNIGGSVGTNGFKRGFRFESIAKTGTLVQGTATTVKSIKYATHAETFGTYDVVTALSASTGEISFVGAPGTTGLIYLDRTNKANTAIGTSLQTAFNDTDWTEIRFEKDASNFVTIRKGDRTVTLENLILQFNQGASKLIGAVDTGDTVSVKVFYRTYGWEDIADVDYDVLDFVPKTSSMRHVADTTLALPTASQTADADIAGVAWTLTTNPEGVASNGISLTPNKAGQVAFIFQARVGSAVEAELFIGAGQVGKHIISLSGNQSIQVWQSSAANNLGLKLRGNGTTIPANTRIRVFVLVPQYSGPAGASIAGPRGPGVPASGSQGDFLRKKSALDHDTEWFSLLATAAELKTGTSTTKVPTVRDAAQAIAAAEQAFSVWYGADGDPTQAASMTFGDPATAFGSSSQLRYITGAGNRYFRLSDGPNAPNNAGIAFSNSQVNWGWFVAGAIVKHRQSSASNNNWATLLFLGCESTSRPTQPHRAASSVPGMVMWMGRQGAGADNARWRIFFQVAHGSSGLTTLNSRIQSSQITVHGGATKNISAIESGVNLPTSIDKPEINLVIIREGRRVRVWVDHTLYMTIALNSTQAALTNFGSEYGMYGDHGNTSGVSFECHAFVMGNPSLLMALRNFTPSSPPASVFALLKQQVKGDLITFNEALLTLNTRSWATKAQARALSDGTTAINPQRLGDALRGDGTIAEVNPSNYEGSGTDPTTVSNPQNNDLFYDTDQPSIIASANLTATGSLARYSTVDTAWAPSNTLAEIRTALGSAYSSYEIARKFNEGVIEFGTDGSLIGPFDNADDIITAAARPDSGYDSTKFYLWLDKSDSKLKSLTGAVTGPPAATDGMRRALGPERYGTTLRDSTGHFGRVTARLNQWRDTGLDLPSSYGDNDIFEFVFHNETVLAGSGSLRCTGRMLRILGSSANAQTADTALPILDRANTQLACEQGESGDHKYLLALTATGDVLIGMTQNDTDDIRVTMLRTVVL